MQNFFSQNKVLVIEERILRRRVLATLHWSETSWYSHWIGKTKLKPAERICMEKILQDIRDEVEQGLDLIEYNNNNR